MIPKEEDNKTFKVKKYFAKKVLIQETCYYKQEKILFY